MSLVNYSSSEDEDANLASKKRCIRDESETVEFTSKSHNSEKMAAHDGRIRTFAHERGNWATYVHIPCPLNDAIKELQDKFVQLGASFKIHPMKNVHISLTRTVVLHHHWINDFVQSIERQIKGISLNTLYFSHLKVYRNEEGTRAFIGLVLDQSSNKSVERLVDICDGILKEYKLQEFYKERSMHASICWWVENGTPEETELLKLDESFQEAYNDCFHDFRIHCNEILCEAGNRTYKMKLK